MDLDDTPMLNQAPQQAYESKTPIDKLVAWFEDSEEATDTARKAAERDRDYYDGKQLTTKELASLRKRKQPDIVINRIAPKINFLCGYEAANRTDPRAYPRTPQDEEAAEAATDALRFVKDSNDLDLKFSRAWENMLVEGYGGVELVVEPKGEGQDPDISVVEWDWDRLFYDHHSRKLDFSDARYVGGVIWMDMEEAKARWPGKEQLEALERTVADSTSNSTTYEDRPHKQWVSGRHRDRIRICQMYHVEDGQWWQCFFTKGGKLESIPVPFVDQDGRSWCPMQLGGAFIDRDNNRYGLVRIMIGVQDEVNKRRSKALHRTATRTIIMEAGAVDDEDKAREEAAKPDGLIKVNPGMRFEFAKNEDQLSAELGLLQEAKNEIELMGPNPAMLGKDKDAPSGRAILANQQSGQTEITLLLDRHRQLKKRVYQRIWDLIRQYKQAEWWVRVTDNENNVKFVGLNRPVTMREELEKRLASKGAPPEMIGQYLDEQQAMGAPLDQVIKTENQPTRMFMDITLEEVPDMANIQEEQFQALVKLAPAVTFPPEIYLQASSLRNKRELIEKMNSANAPAVDPVEAEAKKIAIEQTIKKTEAEIEKLLSEALKTRVEADMAMLPVGQVTDPGLPGAATAGASPAPSPASAPAGQMPQQMPSGPPPEPQPSVPSVPPPGNGREDVMPPPGSTGV